MKKVTVLFLILCLMVPMVSVSAFAADPPAVVSLNVGMENTENDNYKVMDNAINIRKEGVVYELTGTTDRKLQFWGSNDLSQIKTFYLRLNNAAINGGITMNNPNGARLVIELVEGTENTISRVNVVNLTIAGAGTLYATDLGTIASSKEANPGALHITDATVKVTQAGTAATDSSYWNGTCVLDGIARITYVSNSGYSPLKVSTGSLTLKDSARLYCLQENAADPSDNAVDGLAIFEGPLKLQDNAYLEAQGRDSSSYCGYGVMSSGTITVEGNATIKATAYGVALCSMGDLTVNGGTVMAQSVYSNGIFVPNIKARYATIEAEGYYAALFCGLEEGDTALLSLENSTLKAEAKADCAVYSRDTMGLKDSLIQAKGDDEHYAVYANNGVTVSGCWIETSGPEKLNNGSNSIADSVLFNGDDGSVIGNAAIPADVTVREMMKLAVPADTALIVPENKTLTNNGKITLAGRLERRGTVICNSHSGGTATCTEKAKCDVCQISFGETDAERHTGEKGWTVTEKTHGQKWICCGAVTVAEENHMFKNGVCEKCEYTCRHSGGTATCTQKATCEICGEAYGNPNRQNHDGLTHTPAKAATKDAEGNIEYWYCNGCHRYFSDAAASEEITRAATVTKKQGDGSQTPPTGETGNVALLTVLLFISGSAVTGMTVIEKKKRCSR